MERDQGIWRRAHQGAELKSLTSGMQPNGAVAVRATHNLSAVQAEWQTTYTVYASGDIVVAANFKPSRTNLRQLPRLGMQMELPPGFEQLTWLGPGPHETYSDRKDAKVAVYGGKVSEQLFVHYTEPGESGNKVDARWAALRHKSGVGLLAIGAPTLSVNALHHTTEDLMSAKHPHELPVRDFVVLNLDQQQQGVGGDDSWGAWPHPQFLIPCREQAYSFRLRPFSGGEDPAKLGRTKLAAPAMRAD